MKNKITYWLFALAFAVLGAGCSEFLSEAPDNRVEIDALEDVDMLVASAYNEFGVRFTDICSDNYTRSTGVGTMYSIIEDLYSWSQNIREQEHQDSPSTFWEMAYKSIATVNHALEYLGAMNVASEDTLYAGTIRGEALIIRSFQHFMLVNLFAPHYDPETATTDLGVPYVRTIEKVLIQHYDRNTVEEVYNEAEKDMLEGIRLIEAGKQYYQKDKYHFTLPSIYLYASRFYTWRNRDKEDVQKAIQYADRSISAFGGMDVMRDWKDYQQDSKGPTDVNQQEVGLVQLSDTWTAGLPLAYAMTNSLKNQELGNPWKFDDVRFHITYTYPGDICAPAFYYVVERMNYQTAIDMFPLAEAMLNAAEGYARNGFYDKALVYLHELGKHVYEDYNKDLVHVENIKSYYNIEDGIEAMLTYILFERRMMFLQKGIRWFDIRRYHLEVEHLLLDGRTIRLSDVNPKRCFQIPRSAINTGMEPNR